VRLSAIRPKPAAYTASHDNHIGVVGIHIKMDLLYFYLYVPKRFSAKLLNYTRIFQKKEFNFTCLLKNGTGYNSKNGER
jgi:hypothetical protein